MENLKRCVLCKEEKEEVSLVEIRSPSSGEVVGRAEVCKGCEERLEKDYGWKTRRVEDEGSEV